MKLFSENNQKGFSAVGLFFLILAVLMIMNFTGAFKPMLSEVTDKNTYEAAGSKNIGNKKGLLISDLEFETPPSIVPTASITPGPSTVKCRSDSGIKIDTSICECPQMTYRCSGEKAIEINGRPNQFPHNDQFCRPPLMRDDGEGYYCVGKPVIYLYPTAPMLVNVKVKTEGKIFISDPQIEDENSWKNVMAHPNGILFYKGKPYRELFFESKTPKLNAPKKGIIIQSGDLNHELLELITKLGLTKEDEQKEFLEWWIPRLQGYNSPYWFVSILDKEEKHRLDTIEITPKPDTFIEFIAYFRPLEESITIDKLEIPTAPKRVGFTAVEWGGVIDPSND